METLTKDTKCSAFVYRGPWSIRANSHCEHRAIVLVDGKPYCKIHETAYIKAKEERRQKERDAEWAAKQEQWALQKARLEATRGLTAAELVQVTPELIRSALRQAYISKAMDRE